MIDPVIAKLAAYAKLSEQDRRTVQALCTDIRAVAKNKELAREGTAPESLFFVVDGWAARFKMLPNGFRQITSLLLPGDFCDTGVGVVARMDYSVTALTAARVAWVTQAALNDAVRGRPALARALRWSDVVDEAILRTWMVNIGRRDAYSRTAHLLCELHARLKRVGLTASGKIDFPLTQEQLADVLGLTSVHVNRTLQRLRAVGLVYLQNHILTVPDPPLLAATAGFDPMYLQA